MKKRKKNDEYSLYDMIQYGKSRKSLKSEVNRLLKKMRKY